MGQPGPSSAYEQSLHGSILGIRELTEQQREATRAELAWLETDLIRRRKRLVYWTMRKAQAETMDIPDDLRRNTLYFHAQAGKPHRR